MPFPRAIRALLLALALGSLFSAPVATAQDEPWQGPPRVHATLASAPADQWTTIERGTSIGATYTKNFAPVTARYVRLKINDSGALPCFSELQVYAHP